MSDQKYLDVSQCTPGEWCVTSTDLQGAEIISTKDRDQFSPFIAMTKCPGKGFIKNPHDAALIADAGTTAHRTGKSPSQLADELHTLAAAMRQRTK